MSFGDHVAGFVVFLLTVGPSLAAAWMVLGRLRPQLRGAARAVAYGILATAAVILAHLVPGILGVLSRGTAVATALLLLLGAALFARRAAPGRGGPGPAAPRGAPPAHRGLWALAAVGAVGVAAFALAQLSTRGASPLGSIDMLTFHLPGIARWVQDGTFWRIDQFVPDLAHGNYPHHGDVVLLSTVLPWHNDAFVRLPAVPYLALTALAVYALAAHLRAPRPAAVLAGALVVALPVVTDPALEQAMPDAIMLATFAGGALFLLRGDLVLAGLGLGIAFGTKWYGVSSVVALLAVWGGALLVARTPLRDVLRRTAIVAGTVAAAGGFWLVRNWVKSGNPLFPVKLELAGVTIFDAPPDPIREAGGWTIAHYATDFGVWVDYLLPTFRDSLGAGGVLVLAAAVLAAVVGRRDPRVLATAVAVVVLAGVYAITPYTALGPEGRPTQADANVRYLVPALLLAAPLAAWLAGRVRYVVEAILLLAIGDALARSYDVSRLRVLVFALALLAVAAAAWWLRGRAVPRAALAAGAAVLVVLGGLAAHTQQRRFNDGRYARTEAPIRSIVTQAPADRRIGLANTWSNAGLSPIHPAFGERLENEVEFVGPWVREMLRQHRSRDAFLAHVRRGGYDLMVVGRGAPPGPAGREEAWLRGDGWRPVAESPRLALFARR